MRGVRTKTERSDPTTRGDVPPSECQHEALPADPVWGPGEEPDCPVRNDWDEV
jgi:hypothetical protein